MDIEALGTWPEASYDAQQAAAIHIGLNDSS